MNHPAVRAFARIIATLHKRCISPIDLATATRRYGELNSASNIATDDISRAAAPNVATATTKRAMRAGKPDTPS